MEAWHEDDRSRRYARIELLLTELRLPAVKAMWAKFAAQSDKEGWPAARFLAALAEHEIADRDRRRIERHLAEARLPGGEEHCPADGLGLEEIPQVRGLDVEVHCLGLRALAQRFGKRQEQRHHGNDDGDLFVRSGSVFNVLGMFDLLVRFSHRGSPLVHDVGS
jgi:hypothetical protein